MSSAAYWSGRVRRHGHTGWSDAATYLYDQRLRLKAVRQVLSEVPEWKPSSALDFGCGVGDFSAMLAGCVDTVVGYDPVDAVIERARRINPAANLRYVSTPDALWAQRYDLILSITVLQHVLKDTELQTLLHRFAAALNAGGRVIVLETLADMPRDAGHLKRRTLPQLVAAFDAAGLKPVVQRGFYHPTECPTAAYRAFRRRPLVRLLARLASWRVAPARALLQRIAVRAADADTAYLDQPASPTQMLVFARKPQ